MNSSLYRDNILKFLDFGKWSSGYEMRYKIFIAQCYGKGPWKAVHNPIWFDVRVDDETKVTDKTQTSCCVAFTLRQLRILLKLIPLPVEAILVWFF